LIRKIQFFENYFWFSLSFPFAGATWRAPAVPAVGDARGHHWLPEHVPVPVLSELWAIRTALSRSKPLICKTDPVSAKAEARKS